MNLIQIQQLIDQNRLKEAYTGIQQYIQATPDDKEGQKLLKQITGAIQQQNKAQISTHIAKIKTLIKNQQFEEAMALGLKIKPYDPENGELNKLISQAYEEHNKGKTTQKASLQANLIKQVNQLKKQGQYPKAIQLVESHYAKTRNPGLQQLNIDLRNEFVSSKLAANKKNMKLLPAAKVLEFLKGLQKLAPKHPQLPAVIKEYEQDRTNKQAIDRKHYLKEAQRQIKVLFFQGKHAKSIQVCLEVIKADPKNHLARKFFLKNNKALEVHNHKTAHKNLKAYHKNLAKLSQPQLQAEYIRV